MSLILKIHSLEKERLYKGEFYSRVSNIFCLLIGHYSTFSLAPIWVWGLKDIHIQIVSSDVKNGDFFWCLCHGLAL